MLTIPFSTIRDQLDSLLVATANKLEREFPAALTHGGDAANILRSLVLVAQNTYLTMRYFCADSPPDPARKRSFALSVPPLARTILDGLFTVTFLCEDLPERSSWYEKAGWREMKEYYDRATQRYGGDQAWQQHLVEYSELLDMARQWWQITAEEVADAKKIKYWPTPSQTIMLASDDGARSFLAYMNDWFYRELSQDSHVSWPGLSRRAAYLLIDRPTDVDRENLAKQKSDSLLTAIIILAALLSEIECALHFGFGERLKYVWSVINTLSSASREIFDMRYRDRFGAA